MEFVPPKIRMIHASTPSLPSSTALPFESLYRRACAQRTLADLIPLMKDHQLKELQDTVLEACLAHELEEHRLAEQRYDEKPLDWTLPIRRRLNKYPTGRMHKAYTALLKSGYEKIDYFAKVMAGMA